MKKLIATILIIFPWALYAQTDSLGFSENQFIFLVDKYHPIASQAGLLEERGKAKVLAARGSFDPVIGGQVSQKYFQSKQYYSLVGGGLQVPTWYGLDFNLGFSENEGDFLNNQNYQPQGGLVQAGFSLPVLKGLWFDERRRDVKQAKVFYESSLNQRRVMVNDLRFDALSSYWEWVAASNQLEIANDAIVLAEQRLAGIRGKFSFGEVSGIDTLEAYIQRQNRGIMLNSVQLKLKEKELKMGNYLWFEGGKALSVKDSLFSPDIDVLKGQESPVSRLIDRTEAWSVDSNPLVIEYNLKRDAMEWERKYKAEQLKPQVDLKYNLLNETVADAGNPVWNENDYTWGVKAKFPLFLRKARGELKMAKLKIQDIDYAIMQKRLEVQNKLEFFKIQNDQLKQQLIQYEEIVKNYKLLLNGERVKFDNGESSLFLINSREIKLIEAQMKYIDLFCKLQIAQRGLFWVQGDLAKVNLD